MRKPYGHWTLERCQESALQYDTRAEWKRGCHSAYYAARRNDWLEECCGHMVCGMRLWTLERCQESALQYETRKEWMRGARGAYNAARRNDWMEECCDHMVPSAKASDNDAVYIWRAVGQLAWGRRLYKIGVTSFRLGEERIHVIARIQGFTPIIKVLTQVPDAFAVERQLKKLGRQPFWLEGDGKTEFRGYTQTELQQAIQYIEGLTE